MQQLTASAPAFNMVKVKGEGVTLMSPPRRNAAGEDSSSSDDSSSSNNDDAVDEGEGSPYAVMAHLQERLQRIQAADRVPPLPPTSPPIQFGSFEYQYPAVSPPFDVDPLSRAVHFADPLEAPQTGPLFVTPSARPDSPQQPGLPQPPSAPQHQGSPQLPRAPQGQGTPAASSSPQHHVASSTPPAATQRTDEDPDLLQSLREAQEQRDRAENERDFARRRLNEELARASPSAQLQVEERVNQVFQRMAASSSSPSAPTAMVDADSEASAGPPVRVAAEGVAEGVVGGAAAGAEGEEEEAAMR